MELVLIKKWEVVAISHQDVAVSGSVLGVRRCRMALPDLGDGRTVNYYAQEQIWTLCHQCEIEPLRER